MKVCAENEDCSVYAHMVKIYDDKGILRYKITDKNDEIHVRMIR